jgi:hypothetical protein
MKILPKTTKLMLLDSLLKEVAATLPHLVFQRNIAGDHSLEKREKWRHREGQTERPVLRGVNQTS